MARRYSGFTYIICAFVACTAAAASCPVSSASPIALTIANHTLASQNTSTFGIRLDVGDPKQNVCLMPSTVVDNTLLVSRNICATGQLQNLSQAQCLSYHGGTFNLATAGVSFHNISTSSASLATDSGWSKFNPPYSVAGATDVELISDASVPNMTVVVITEGINFSAGHIGIGKESVLLHQLKDSNAIPSLGFGMNAGSQSIQNPRDGNLVLGGYDAASVASSFYSYPINYSDTLAGRHCPLQVYIEKLQLLLDGVEEPVELLGEGDGHRACIEPYDNLFRLSRVGLESFQRATGWSSRTTYDADELFVAEPGLMYPSKAGFNGSLRYVLEKGFTVEIPNFELQHPLRGLDGNGSRVLQPDITEVNIYGEPLGAWVLGKVFLSRVYLAVNYDAEEIQLAEVSQNEVTPSPANFASAITACRDHKLSGGTIAAIVLGAAIGLALIGALTYCLFRKRRRQAHLAPNEQEPQDFHRLYEDHPPVAEANMTNQYPLQHEITEMSVDRTTSELDTSNGGYTLESHCAHVISPLDGPRDDDLVRKLESPDAGRRHERRTISLRLTK